ncbi:MAG: ATP-grasp domain-containing protein [Proteobacteria bacterium]|nr:ATP-grasp domain-containing protein [Pseudomonadota bacterium]
MISHNVCVIAQSDPWFVRTLSSSCRPFFVAEDIRDPSVLDRIVKSILDKKATPEEIHFILTTNEAFVPSCARLAERVGLPFLSSENAKIMRNKVELYKRLTQSGVRCPESYHLNEDVSENSLLEGTIVFPCVVKPAAGFASMNVEKIDNIDELKRVIPLIRRNSSVRLGQLNAELGIGSSLVIQEYIRGIEFAVDFLVLDGRVQWLEIFGRNPACSSNFPDQLYARLTKGERSRYLSSFASTAQKVADAFEVRSGWMQIEVIVDGQGETRPCVVDAAYRLAGGGLNSLVIERATGQSPLKAFLNQRAPVADELSDHSVFLYYINPCRRGRFVRLHGREDPLVKDSVLDFFLNSSKGDMVYDSVVSGRYFGALIGISESFAHSLKLSEYFDRTLKVEVG